MTIDIKQKEPAKSITHKCAKLGNWAFSSMWFGFPLVDRSSHWRNETNMIAICFIPNKSLNHHHHHHQHHHHHHHGNSDTSAPVPQYMLQIVHSSSHAQAPKALQPYCRHLFAILAAAFGEAPASSLRAAGRAGASQGTWGRGEPIFGKKNNGTWLIY